MPTALVDLTAIHQAVCDTINVTLPDVRCYPSYRPNMVPPCVVVVGARTNYVQLDQTLKQGTVVINVVLTLLGPSGDRTGQEQIMRWLSVGAGQDESLAAALVPVNSDGSQDRTLGGAVSGFTFGSTRYAAALEYPAGSGSIYAVSEIELDLHV